MWISVFNLNLETPDLKLTKKLNVFNFQLSCFSAIVDFIIWFCTSLSAEKSGVLNLFLSHFFFMLSSKRGFSNPAFQNSRSNPTRFWKPEQNPFQTWKRPFLVYFKRATNFNLSDLKRVTNFSWRCHLSYEIQFVALEWNWEGLDYASKKMGWFKIKKKFEFTLPEIRTSLFCHNQNMSTTVVLKFQ